MLHACRFRFTAEQNLAAIGGRAFVNGADYRSLVDRFRAGELNDLLESRPFENVIFAESERLDQLSERLQKAECERSAQDASVQQSNVQRPKSGLTLGAQNFQPDPGSDKKKVH